MAVVWYDSGILFTDTRLCDSCRGKVEAALRAKIAERFPGANIEECPRSAVSSRKAAGGMWCGRVEEIPDDMYVEWPDKWNDIWENCPKCKDR